MRDGDLDAALAAARIAVTHHHRVGDRPGLPGTLLTTAEILIAAGAYRPAVVLAVAARGGVLSPLAAGMGVAGSALVEPLARAGEALGDVGTEAAIAEGTALSYEGLVAYALDAIDTARAELEASDG